MSRSVQTIAASAVLQAAAQKVAPLPPGYFYDVTYGGVNNATPTIHETYSEHAAPVFTKSSFGTSLFTGLRSIAGIGLAPFTGGTSLTSLLPTVAESLKAAPHNPTMKGRVPMGFFDDIFGNSDTIGAGGFDAGVSGGTPIDYGALLNTGVGLATRYLGGSSQGNLMMPAQLTSATLPAVIGTGTMVVRGAMTALVARLAAVGLTRASAWSLLKSQGPTALLALGLTAAEVVTVARKGSGRRRMNMCNGRALRRAQRRLTSFHNFYKKTCGMPTYRHKKRTCK